LTNVLLGLPAELRTEIARSQTMCPSGYARQRRKSSTARGKSPRKLKIDGVVISRLAAPIAALGVGSFFLQNQRGGTVAMVAGVSSSKKNNLIRADEPVNFRCDVSGMIGYEVSMSSLNRLLHRLYDAIRFGPLARIRHD
jgi:hypothetical protein